MAVRLVFFAPRVANGVYCSRSSWITLAMKCVLQLNSYNLGCHTQPKHVVSFNIHFLQVFSTCPPYPPACVKRLSSIALIIWKHLQNSKEEDLYFSLIGRKYLAFSFTGLPELTVEYIILINLEIQVKLHSVASIRWSELVKWSDWEAGWRGEGGHNNEIAIRALMVISCIMHHVLISIYYIIYIISIDILVAIAYRRHWARAGDLCTRKRLAGGQWISHDTPTRKQQSSPSTLAVNSICLLCLTRGARWNINCVLCALRRCNWNLHPCKEERCVGTESHRLENWSTFGCIQWVHRKQFSFLWRGSLLSNRNRTFL